MFPAIPVGDIDTHVAEILRQKLSHVQVETSAEHLTPPYAQLVVESVPSSATTAVTRWVRLQLTATVINADYTADYDKAARITEQAYTLLCDLPGRIVSCSIDSGPIRSLDANKETAAYLVALLTVTQ